MLVQGKWYLVLQDLRVLRHHACDSRLGDANLAQKADARCHHFLHTVRQHQRMARYHLPDHLRRHPDLLRAQGVQTR
eukprot:4893815-Pyramimonas_sp.AAC.1